MATVTKRLDLSTPHVLRSEQEYDVAMAEIDALLDRAPDAGTPEHDRLELLTVLVQAYDENHYPMGDRATPQAVVDFALEQHGMTRAALASILGGRSRVSEFFAGKRRLSISQVRKLRDVLNIPGDVLLEDAGVRYEAGGRSSARRPSRVQYRVDDPSELFRMPARVELPDRVSRERPLEVYLPKATLLDILDMNVVNATKNMRRDAPQWNAVIKAVVARLKTFRDWVTANPNKHVFAGLYPAQEFDVIDESGPGE